MLERSTTRQQSTTAYCVSFFKDTKTKTYSLKTEAQKPSEEQKNLCSSVKKKTKTYSQKTEAQKSSEEQKKLMFFCLKNKELLFFCQKKRTSVLLSKKENICSSV